MTILQNDYKMSTIDFSEEIELESIHGNLNMVHASKGNNQAIIIRGNKDLASPIPIRIQSSCVFGESFRVTECDCSAQLDFSLNRIINEGGILIYHFDEGRGAGLRNKFKSIRIQQTFHFDTRKAFEMLELRPDMRTFEFESEILKSLVSNNPIELMTNNPRKVIAIKKFGLNVVKVSNVITVTNPKMKEYFEEKMKVLGHRIY